eukprot:TRINITY_DN7603_c0_g1_i3.p1 TRINITY_DN7603_c0_g1~~TRINITY_DN7603_c0_g1_i3.p1  ORF type:complete len:268 (+),score=53.42 TRINITY_DN7603_c0_g1_i3:72-875(+)
MAESKVSSQRPQKGPPAKPVLESPYKISIKSVNAETEAAVVERFKKFVADYKADCAKNGIIVKKGASKKAKKPQAGSHEPKQEQESSAPQIDRLSAYFKFGINEVTRGLEKGTIDAAIVFQDIKPVHMIHHLFPLAHTRKASIMPFSTAKPFCRLFGMRRLACVGLVKPTTDDAMEETQGNEMADKFKDLRLFLTSSSPKIDLPWLRESSIHKVAASVQYKKPVTMATTGRKASQRNRKIRVLKRKPTGGTANSSAKKLKSTTSAAK